jgi:hypothetical protein
MPPQAPEPAPHDAPGPSRPLRAPRVPRKRQASSPPPDVRRSTRNRQPPQPWWEVPSLRPCVPAPIIDLDSSESPSESSEDELDLLRPGTDDDHDLQEAFIASAVEDGIDFLAGDFLQLDDTFQYAFECAIPIRLANSELVYAVGIGSVRFQPVVEGHRSRVVEFTRVLQVPELRSNLLSVLYLTQHKAIQVIISHGLMSLSRTMLCCLQSL